MEQTAISKSQAFADAMAHSIAIYRAQQEAKKNPEAKVMLTEIVAVLATQLVPAEA